ncbi:MAG: hypothetical protein OEZ41_09770 [Nitrospirota bacterium]|nr:hypothetical protein [Nitrospirota bacterium]
MDDPIHISKAIIPLQEMLTYVEKMFIRSARREANNQYFLGMLMLGLPSLIFLSLFFVIAVSQNTISSGHSEPLFASFVAGAFGALISVMSRMGFGNLGIDYWALPKNLRIWGGLRVLVGAFFGIMIYAMIAGGFLPLAIPSDPQKQIFFHAVFGWLAGFNERWAQDILVNVGSSIQTKINGKSEQAET